MFTALYLDLSGKKEYFYEKEFLQSLRKLFPEVLTLDIDIQSEASLIEYTIKLLKESERSVIMIEPGEKIPPSIFSVFEITENAPGKYLYILNEKNERLEALFSGMPDIYLIKNVSMDQALATASGFLRNGQ